MDVWTRDQVEDRLAEAADVLKRLPEVRVQGYFNAWPQMIHAFSDLVGQARSRMRRAPPPPAAITRMEQTLDWLRWLEPQDAKLVWARAEGAPWKPICWRFGLSRATAHRRWEYALSVITWRLNGRRPPAKRSQRFVVETTQRLSS